MNFIGLVMISDKKFLLPNCLQSISESFRIVNLLSHFCVLIKNVQSVPNSKIPI